MRAGRGNASLREEKTGESQGGQNPWLESPASHDKRGFYTGERKIRTFLISQKQKKGGESAGGGGSPEHDIG